MNIATEAFNTKQVCSIIGVTPREVNHWDKKGIVKPSIRPAAGKGSQRLYSYADILAFKTVKNLRVQGTSLQKIGKCVRYLRQHLPDISQPLPFCTLFADDDTIFLQEDEATLLDTVKSQGQQAFICLNISAIDMELRSKVLELSGKRVEEVTVGDYAYQVTIEPDFEDGGYVAEVAGLSGCITQGDTLDEVREMVVDAIGCYLEVVNELQDRGITLPVKKRKLRKNRRA
ncbi:MAG: MerR family transcriptional regulator [Phycisphaerae bacterium]|nr:MerR family transcriptional regulator [Phycisphaerae bacterium]